MPSENGLATYQFTPKSKQVKPFNIRVEYNNSFYDDGMEIYKKAFEIAVLDCD